jgi:hypothetical protein
MGRIAVDESLRDRDANEISVVPIKEYSGGGDSKNGSSVAKCRE